MRKIEPREHISDDELDPNEAPRFGRSAWRESWRYAQEIEELTDEQMKGEIFA